MNQSNRNSSSDSNIRLSAPYLIVFATLTILASAILLYLWNDQKKERIQDLNYTNAVINKFYERSFHLWNNTLVSVAGQVLAQVGPDSLQRRQKVIDKTTANYDELLAFGFIRPDGQILHLSGRLALDSLPNLSAMDASRRSFYHSKTRNYLSIGEPYLFPHVKNWIIPIRVPVYDDNEKLVAVNTAGIDYEGLRKELDGFGFHSDYKIHLINDHFGTTLLYHPNGARTLDSLLRQDASFIDHGKSKKAFGINYGEHYHPIESANVLCVSSKLENLDHTLYVFVDASILWKDFKHPFFIIIFLYIFLILAFYALFIYYSRRQSEYLGQLSRRQANLDAIFESTNSIIGLFDKNKRLLEYNASFSEYIEKTDDVKLEKGMRVLSHLKNKEMAEVFESYLDRALAGEKFSVTESYPNLTGTLHFYISHSPIYNKDEIIGASMFIRDITLLKESEKKLEEYARDLEGLVQERTLKLEMSNEELKAGNAELEKTLEELKRTQDSLLQAEKMASLGVLAAGIGHEINNPLNFIQNGIEALIDQLKEERPDLKKIYTYEKIVRDGLVRITKIVKSLSEFSRQGTSSDEDCSTTEILENCLTILQSNLKGRVNVVRKYAEYPMIVKGNEGRLHQAFLNILSNADQAIADEGQISIRTWADGSIGYIEISDTGEGINAEQLSKVAEPFFTTKPAGVGTGLGLFITYSIIEEHHGKIELESQLNKGTTVKVILPLKNEHF